MSVDVIRPLQPVELAHKKAARLVDRGRELDERLALFFEEVGAVRVEMMAAGARWSPVLPATVEAAFEAWADRRPPSDVPPVPLMDVEGE